MLFSSAVAVFLISWTSLFLVDYLLRLRNYLPYVEFAAAHGLEVSPFQFRLYTSRWTTDHSSTSASLPSSKAGGGSGHAIRRTLCALWFGIGAVVSLVCLVAITAYLSKLLIADAAHLAALRPRVAPYRAMPPPSPPPTTTAVPAVAEPPLYHQQQQQHELPPPPPPDDYDILDGGQRSENGLVPIVPGVNLPWSHIPIFMLVLILAAVIHELGHSSAALSNDVRVNGFGIFVFALYPGAFTDIDPESLKRSSPLARLMIFGGGIWHNVVLAGFAYLLFMATPMMLSPLYSTGDGVTVTKVDVRSGLHGAAGLSSGQVVEWIDDCRVGSPADWRECVRQLESDEQHGRCVASSQVDAARTDVTTLTEDEVQCCASFANITHAHMCFEATVLMVSQQVETKAPSLHALLQAGGQQHNKIAEEIVRERRELSRQYSCMSARFVTDQPICNSSGICSQESSPNIDDPRVCIYPALFNGTQLARITLRDQTRPVLYVGNLDELISFVLVDALVARWSWVPHWWSEAVQLVPKYLFTLSVALAALNAVPCYALDGQYIVITLVNYFARSLPKRRRQQLIALSLSTGSFLLAANIVIGFVKFLI